MESKDTKDSKDGRALVLVLPGSLLSLVSLRSLQPFRPAYSYG